MHSIYHCLFSSL